MRLNVSFADFPEPFLVFKSCTGTSSGHGTEQRVSSPPGPWERIGDIAHLGYTGRQAEGPALFQFNQEQKWALLVDKPGRGGYFPVVITNFADPSGFKLLPANAYSFGEGEKRHRAKWPSRPAPLAWLKNKLAGPDAVVSAPSKPSSLIQPGEIWPDNRGKHIQAHGGGVIKVGDTWYWFGEDRENQTSPDTKPAFLPTNDANWSQN